MQLTACRLLDVEPENTALFETTHDGLLAGQAGHFEAVVMVDQDGNAASLRAQGADRVVADLGEILERAVAGTATTVTTILISSDYDTVATNGHSHRPGQEARLAARCADSPHRPPPLHPRPRPRGAATPLPPRRCC